MSPSPLLAHAFSARWTNLRPRYMFPYMVCWCTQVNDRRREWPLQRQGLKIPFAQVLRISRPLCAFFSLLPFIRTENGLGNQKESFIFLETSVVFLVISMWQLCLLVEMCRVFYWKMRSFMIHEIANGESHNKLKYDQKLVLSLD